MLRDDPTERGTLAIMMHVYRFVLYALTRHRCKFFSAITEDGHLPLILHCSAGKDRTGVLSAILLLALGVPRKTVISDYMKTNEYRNEIELKKEIVKLIEPILGIPPSDEMVEIMAGVQPVYLNAALEFIDSRYGSVENYLESAGVGKEQIAKFRSCMHE
jgi:protein-tyrosine phosphatase